MTRDELFNAQKELTNAKAEAYKELVELAQNRCIEQNGCLYSSDIGAVLNKLIGEQRKEDEKND